MEGILEKNTKADYREEEVYVRPRRYSPTREGGMGATIGVVVGVSILANLSPRERGVVL